MIPAVSSRRPLALWLFLTAAAVFLMVLIGAITRLTESGLSITEWRPLTGIIPPLNEAQWHAVFDLYKQSPEFQKKHFWMDLADFKAIFFWEWLHRFWGRMIGLIYALPFFYFLLRGQIPKTYILPLLGLLILGGAQGALGWYMVQSGLVDIPSVSHYRLAAHLALGFLIFALLVVAGLTLIRHHIGHAPSWSLFIHGLLVLVVYSFTMIWGAFTAGLDGGMVYNEWPLMGGRLVPPEAAQSLWDNPAGVQFVHRWLGAGLGVMVWLWWAHAALRGMTFSALNFLALLIAVQMGLGIAAVLSQVQIGIAATHQAGALLVLLFMVIALFQFRPHITRRDD